MCYAMCCAISTQVYGQDAAGNKSPPLDVPFRTDLEPPYVASIVYPNVTKQHRIDINFTVRSACRAHVSLRHIPLGCAVLARRSLLQTLC